MRLIAGLLIAASALLAQPRRIVSTAPSITETLFAIGAGERVVGVSTYCHFPAVVDRLPRVGTYLKPNVEVIARLKPDLVLLQTLPNSVRGQLDAVGVHSVEVESGNLRQNLDAMLAIGKAVGAERPARELLNRIETGFASLRAEHRNAKPITVAFIVGRTPGKLEGLVAVGGGAYLSELVTIAGGRNIFNDSAQGYVKVSLETVLRRNPDVIIDMGEMADTVGVTDAAKQAVVRLWRGQGTLVAVHRQRVHAVASDIFVSPGPRMLDAARAFAALLHQRTQ